MAGPIRIAVLANGAQARRELNQTASVGSRAMGVLGKVGRVAAVGLAAGLAGAAYAAKEFAQSAAADETAAALLARQLKASTGATDAQVKSVERYVTAQGKLLGVTDDELRPALAKLVTATEDIGQAQGLASLAMDVAAARGKSLETVSIAIAKAQDGQVTGLSRLGVETKNAAGETLTFTQLTKKMGDQFGGAAATKAETLQGKLDRLKVRFTEAGEALGAKLLPPLADLAEKALDGVDSLSRFARINIVPKLRDAAKWYRENEGRISELVSTVRDEAGPMLSDLAGAFADVTTEVIRVGGPLAQDLLPALGKLVELGAQAVGVVSGLPGPVRTLAVTAGIAALALPALTANLAASTLGLRAGVGGFAAWSVAATSASTRATAFGLAALKMGQLAKTASGPLGIGAIMVASDKTGTALGALSSIAGGAALGFSVGGPWGALIGGAGGGIVHGLASLRDQTDDTAQSLQESTPKAYDFASSLDSITGAATEATRALALKALQERDAIGNAAALGLSQRTLINATLGQAGAMRTVEEAIAAASATYDQLGGDQASYNASLGQLYGVQNEDAVAKLKQGQAAEQLAYSLGLIAPQLREQSRETRTAAIATSGLLQLFPELRKGAIAKIRTLGTEASVKDALRVGRQLKLVPKDLVTLLRVSGAVESERQAKRVVRALQDAGKTKVDLGPAKTGVVRSLADVEVVTRRGADRIASSFKTGTGKARPNLDAAKPALNTQLSNLAGTGRAGANGIGTAVEQGFGSGFGGAIATWSAAVRAAVNAAIAAGRAAAKAKSPSQETARLGRDLGDGLVVGLASKRSRLERAGRDAIAAIFSDVTGGESIAKALERATALIRKRIVLKDDKAERARERAVLKHLRDQYAALTANGKAQDQIQRKLEAQRDALQALKDEAAGYAAQVKASFVELGNVTQLGQLANGKVSTSKLLADLRDKVLKAQRFASLINQLRGQLNATSLQQLIDAGPEAGLASAEAIAAGGAAAISEINTLSAQLAATGAALGSNMSEEYYGAGIAAAAALVAGLESDSKALERAARRLARKLANAIKEALGIKSPSRVMRGIGGNVIDGLVLGLDDTYVRRQGERVAAAVVSGFGTPALDAYMATGSSAAGAGARVLTLKLAPEAMHQLVRGRELRADIDAWDDAGGASSIVVVRP